VTATTKPIRTAGTVPAEYRGPVWYRTAEDTSSPAPRSRFRFRDDKARLERLLNARNRGRHVLGSGLVVDESGALLPEWQTPLTAELIGSGRPDRVEYNRIFEAGVLVSERVHDAIAALEPGRHIFVPVDVASEGRMLRNYVMFVGLSHFWDTDVAILHPARNQLERWVYTSSQDRLGWRKPDWVRPRYGEAEHFGYLDGRVVDGLHLLSSGLVDNAHVFSPKLFEAFARFGDIFQGWHALVPVGISFDDDAAYQPKVLRPPEPPARRPGLMQRLFGRG
jgi:hypothetical protein